MYGSSIPRTLPKSAVCVRTNARVSKAHFVRLIRPKIVSGMYVLHPNRYVEPMTRPDCETGCKMGRKGQTYVRST